MPRTRRSYPSDLTDQEWNLLAPLLASPERRGRPPKWPARRIADAVFYLLRSGCAWRMLPREYPPWQTVSTTTFANGAWTASRLLQAHERLRAAVPQAEGRNPDPSGAVIDSQAVKGSDVGGPERGYDMGPSVYPVENAICWWTPTGWCSVHKYMPQACTIETVGRGFSTTSWPRSCPG